MNTWNHPKVLQSGGNVKKSPRAGILVLLKKGMKNSRE
jgi:hypothetical protein